MTRRSRLIFGVLLLLAVSLSCASRYRLVLNMTLDGNEERVKVESSEYAERCGLGDPYADTKTVSSSTSCLVVTVRGRGLELPLSKENVVRFDEYTTCRLYVELPSIEKGASVNLVDNAFVQRLGRYDIPADEKIYLPSSGTFVADSVRGDDLYATIHGTFATRMGTGLVLNGQFRARVK